MTFLYLWLLEPSSLVFSSSSWPKASLFVPLFSELSAYITWNVCQKQMIWIVTEKHQVKCPYTQQSTSTSHENQNNLSACYISTLVLPNDEDELGSFSYTSVQSNAGSFLLFCGLYPSTRPICTLASSFQWPKHIITKHQADFTLVSIVFRSLKKLSLK